MSRYLLNVTWQGEEVYRKGFEESQWTHEALVFKVCLSMLVSSASGTAGPPEIQTKAQSPNMSRHFSIHGS